MLYKIKDIGEGGLDLRLPVTAAWLGLECADLGAKPGPKGLTLTARLDNSGDDFLLRGNLHGSLEMSCARCLEPAFHLLNVPVTVMFSEKPAPADDDDDDDLEAVDVITFEGGVIDLGLELRDQILMATPLSVLCKEDCAGLCAVCGGNRNQEPCDCEAKQRAATSKLGALGNLKI